MYFVIKDIRMDKKITLRELSQTTGLSVSYLSEIENNKVKEPSFSAICKICEVLEEKVEKIYFIPNEINSVRDMLNIYIQKYGLTDARTRKISKMLDEITVKNIANDEIKKGKNVKISSDNSQKKIAIL